MPKGAEYGLKAAKEFFAHHPGRLQWSPSHQKTKCVVTYAKYGNEIRKEVRSGNKVVTGFFSPEGKQVKIGTNNGEITTTFEDGYRVTDASSNNFQFMGEDYGKMRGTELELNKPTTILNESKFYLFNDLGHAQAERFIQAGGEMRPTRLGGGFYNNNGIVWPDRRNGLDIEELQILHEPNPLNGIPNSSASVTRFAEGHLEKYYTSQDQYLGEIREPNMSPANVFKKLIEYIKNA